MEKKQDLIDLVENAEWFVTEQTFPYTLVEKKVKSRRFLEVSWGELINTLKQRALERIPSKNP